MNPAWKIDIVKAQFTGHPVRSPSIHFLQSERIEIAERLSFT